jgi:hypothetical protein
MNNSEKTKEFISTLKNAHQHLLNYRRLSERIKANRKSKKSKRKTRLEQQRIRRDLLERDKIVTIFAFSGSSVFQEAIRLQLPTRPDNVLHFAEDWTACSISNEAEEKDLVDRTEAELLQLINEAEALIPKTTGGGKAGAEDLTDTKQNSGKKISTNIKTHFKIEESRIFFDDVDLDLPTGKTIDVAKMLIESFDTVVKYNLLDNESTAKEASDNLRKHKSIIQKKLKNTSYYIKTKKQAGYILTAK